jgi:hypothetical protein
VSENTWATLLGIIFTTALALFTLLLNEHYKRASHLATELWELKHGLMKSIGYHLSEIGTTLYYDCLALSISYIKDDYNSNKVLYIWHYVIKPSFGRLGSDKLTFQSFKNFQEIMDPTDQDYENLLASLNAEIRYYHRTMIQVLFDKINIAKWELGLVVTDRPMLDDLNTIIEEYANFYTDAPTAKKNTTCLKTE